MPLHLALRRKTSKNTIEELSSHGTAIPASPEIRATSTVERQDGGLENSGRLKESRISEREAGPGGSSQIRPEKSKDETRVESSHHHHYHHHHQHDGDLKAHNPSYSMDFNGDIKMHFSKKSQLSTEEIKMLFSGAPHFNVIAEENGKAHAQVIFPWDKQLKISDLLDRRPIMHESFHSATLHAHLPVPGNPAGWPTQTRPISPVSPSSPISPSSTAKKQHAKKRPAFELGVFETPNMLSYSGKEPGTIGMRNFLEIPLSDSLRSAEQDKETAIALSTFQLKNMSSMDAFKAMQNGEQTMNIGKNAMWKDRLTFVHDRKSWKELSLRDISMEVINARAAVITPWYNKMAEEGWRRTILDETDADTLYDELFSLMLYPARKISESTDKSLEVQIKALINVLSTPGAWVDLSLVDSRLRLGEILWEVPTAESMHPMQNPGAQRHWLLVQILLSIELAIRLDAALREQKTHHFEGDIIPEIKLFNSLRTRKVDWDIVIARRFLDHLVVEEHAGAFPPPTTRPVMAKRQTSHVFSKWRQRMEDRHSVGEASNWDFVVLPRHLELQVDGLLRFAEAIRWSNMEDFERCLRARVERWNSASCFSERKTFVGPLQRTKLPSAVETPKLSQPPQARIRNDNSELRMELQPASEYDSGGWLSRSWFSSLILPGESISHILISSVLEHDPKALDIIGCHADLHGGFVLDGQSWWSKACVVGKVMAAYDGGVECIGWVGTPNVQPLDQARNPVPNKWLTIVSHATHPSTGRLRVHAGKAMTEESSPLGSGRGRIVGLDFLCAMDKPSSTATREEDAKYDGLILRSTGRPDHFSAAVAFTLSAANNSAAPSSKAELLLTHDVHFVSAHACRVPRIRVILPHDQPPNSISVADDDYVQCEKLPGHLLHTTFGSYEFKRVSELLAFSAPDPDKVTVIDARARGAAGSKEVFARAWCSSVGRHALVSRVGRTCLSCSIREAKALDVGVVIRIGHLD